MSTRLILVSSSCSRSCIQCRNNVSSSSRRAGGGRFGLVLQRQAAALMSTSTSSIRAAISSSSMCYALKTTSALDYRRHFFSFANYWEGGGGQGGAGNSESSVVFDAFRFSSTYRRAAAGPSSSSSFQNGSWNGSTTRLTGTQHQQRMTKNPARRRRLLLQQLQNGDGSSTKRTRMKHRRLEEEESKSDAKSSSNKIFPVSAIHIAQTIDLFPVLSTLFAQDIIKKQMFNKNSFVVQLPNTGDDDTTTITATTASPSPRYVAVFRFGSIVCFNLSPKHVASLVNDIKEHSTDPVLNGFERRENFGVLVKPPEEESQGSASGEEESEEPPGEEEDAMQVTGDYCVVPHLDVNGVSVISNILAQTVAMDTYNDIVDEILEDLFRINKDVTRTGKFPSSHKDFLFKTVAQNNMIFVDMISKIRIKDRSDTAWNMTKYEPIHYKLKEEFEIDDRFEQIEFKLNLIQQNAKFFLGILQSQKSNSLEWIIVVLIAVECVIMCVDMSGMGENVMAPLLELMQPSPPPPPKA